MWFAVSPYRVWIRRSTGCAARSVENNARARIRWHLRCVLYNCGDNLRNETAERDCLRATNHCSVDNFCSFLNVLQKRLRAYIGSAFRDQIDRSIQPLFSFVTIGAFSRVADCEPWTKLRDNMYPRLDIEFIRSRITSCGSCKSSQKDSEGCCCVGVCRPELASLNLFTSPSNGPKLTGESCSQLKC